ncbi:class I adenylate-forming enzyme family protein [Roseovarius aestuariivivens]|uniref:class I adenylate-forming enzyme family protein n=1 Tax=Roseovarius aestuariivivens TaxID=1888910 RepID=UPI0010818F50|nr:class I adenylate-forming enzyme family protein [Roseovarius aestuariivivens]
MLSETQSAPFAPCPAPFNMAAHVLRHADSLPDKVALAVLGLAGAERCSYARLKAAVLGTGTGFLRAGLSPGDRVLMRLGNTVEFPVAYLGALAVGLVPVPTSSQLTAKEVAEIIDTVQPRLILRAQEVACPDTALPMLGLSELDDMYALPPASFEMGDPDRPGYIIFTSGTSGVPRAVVHAHRAIWARQMMVDGWYGLRQDDRMMHAGAFNWTYTLGTGLMDPWTAGATALIPKAGIAPQQLPLLMKRHDATIFAAAPGVFRKMLAGQLPNLPRLRHALSAGEKLSETVRQDWQAATGTAIHEAFGMSECSTFISASPDRPAAPGTLGRPQAGRRVTILGEDGPVPRGQDGVIAVHRDDPGLMLGYFGARDATAARMREAWFLTGDQGRMSETGDITYLGRADDMMNAGGFRVSPLEVEAVLNTHPGITQSAVTEIEVKRDARLIMAFYTGPRALDLDDLHGFAAARLASYKQPRGFFHLDALPTGANGKLLRRALRPIYEDLHGQA